MGQKWPKTAFIGSIGPWCPQMAGTRWNKIGTVYRQSGLTILTTLHHPKYQNVVPGRSQTGSKGSKTAFIGSMVPQNGKWYLKVFTMSRPDRVDLACCA